MTMLELAKTVAEVLDAKKARDIVLLDIGKLTSIGDYFIIASGGSTTQVKALAEEVEDRLSTLGMESRRVEGASSASWVLLDYYGLIIHVFLDEVREFYALERLWADAPVVDLSDVLTD